MNYNLENGFRVFKEMSMLISPFCGTFLKNEPQKKTV